MCFLEVGAALVILKVLPILNCGQRVFYLGLGPFLIKMKHISNTLNHETKDSFIVGQKSGCQMKDVDIFCPPILHEAVKVCWFGCLRPANLGIFPTKPQTNPIQ